MDQSSPICFRRTWEGFYLITPFSACRYLDPFQRYSKFKVQSCPKSRQVVCRKFYGCRFSKICSHFFISASRHITCTSLVRLYPLASKLFSLIRYILRQFLNYCFSHIFFEDTQIFGSNLKPALFSIIWQSFFGDRWRQLWDITPQMLEKKQKQE